VHENQLLKKIEKIEKLDFEIPEKNEKEMSISKGTSNSYLWINENFPISFQDILPLIGMFSKGSSLLNKLNEVLEAKVIIFIRCFINKKK
jgi:hypothetical protein